jgi:hypothetical protein
VKSKKRKPARSKITTGAEQKARSFSSWSHVVSMLYAPIISAGELGNGHNYGRVYDRADR